MVPEGVTVVAALHTVGAPTLADPDAELDEDVLVCGDRKADKARVARLIELIPGLRAVNAGAAGDGPHRRAADADADLGQHPLQDPRRDQPHRPPRRRPLGLGGAMRVALLAGGTGGAKLGAGMQEEIGAELSVIANTGDDIEMLGVHVSPDPDLDHLLAQRRNRRGARLGDRATTASPSSSAWRGSARRAGSASPTATSPPASTGASSSTRAAARPTPRRRSPAALGVEARVLPMCDSPVRTKVLTAAGRRDLQEYLIVDGGQPEVLGVELEGIDEAEPTAEVLEALRDRRGDRDRPLQPGDQHRPDPRRARDARGDRRLRRPGRRGQPLRRRRRSSRARPSASCRPSAGPSTAAGVASLYAGLIDAMVVDEGDPDPPPSEIPTLAAPTADGGRGRPRPAGAHRARLRRRASPAG